VSRWRRAIKAPGIVSVGCVQRRGFFLEDWRFANGLLLLARLRLLGFVFSVSVEYRLIGVGEGGGEGRAKGQSDKRGAFFLCVAADEAEEAHPRAVLRDAHDGGEGLDISSPTI